MPRINGQEVGTTGHGLMGHIRRPDPIPHERAFEMMRTALAKGMNFWNGGEFYGTPENNAMTLRPSWTPTWPSTQRTPTRQLNGHKKLDVFECARRDPKVPMDAEVAASTIHEAVKHAKIVAVEAELSIFCPEVLTNGVACRVRAVV
ncbi:hypothetical protein MYCTH_2106095 [Thermothelomyces thermophilus ATCC 42464]|uniref:NADP-dependent oxidoreductase domain-containing protein n=1 Tax=Thermothelomyces thermophilus (strain ATCC 42464 / BCRC 31852 / DSM 1799) TaxID=573729 RepID=G2Q0U1_THET4|nr:uncharacterized protein MYCTH_2106095 [Thermothelomyces thermophilus ATCC 42464]AEO53241.1 hypothetical protein MYCTH_2106095 [Thermothelomyces thermophilus ATCC 42464]